MGRCFANASPISLIRALGRLEGMHHRVVELTLIEYFTGVLGLQEAKIAFKAVYTILLLLLDHTNAL